MKEKREMLLKKLNVLIEGREREFLEFMRLCDGSMDDDFSKESLEELLDSFIYFEEDNNEEEITEEVLEETLNVYIKGFIRGEHIF